MGQTLGIFFISHYLSEISNQAQVKSTQCTRLFWDKQPTPKNIKLKAHKLLLILEEWDSLFQQSFSRRTMTSWNWKSSHMCAIFIKALQIDMVANLSWGHNTFLLAGMGFEKSRIAEIYQPNNKKGLYWSWNCWMLLVITKWKRRYLQTTLQSKPKRRTLKRRHQRQLWIGSTSLSMSAQKSSSTIVPFKKPTCHQNSKASFL